jgi:hypothetical protein
MQPPRPWDTACRASLAGLLLGVVGASHAAIYVCTDPAGKRITSDREMAFCSADRRAQCCNGSQRELNSDGSPKREVAPPPTADERAEIEARQQQEVFERASRVEAMRRDRNLLARFPNEAAHKKAREAALEDTRKSLTISEARLAALQKERKPLLDEAEFYVGKPLPGKLKLQLDGNEAATDAQKSLILNQQAELVRINENYDTELERLRKLWAGAQPGSLGALPKPTPAAPSGPALRRPAP